MLQLLSLMKKSWLLLTLVSAPLAQAAVIYSGVRNLPLPTDALGIYLNLDTGATAGAEFAGWDLNPFFGGFAVANSADFQPARAGAGNTDMLVAYTLGTLINSSLLFSSGPGGSSTHMASVGGAFPLGSPAYLGFRFTPDGAGSTAYGWMQVTFTVNQPGGQINDWAWDNSGQAISAGAVPEPAAGLLATFGAALLWVRRRGAARELEP